MSLYYVYAHIIHIVMSLYYVYASCILHMCIMQMHMQSTSSHHVYLSCVCTIHIFSMHIYCVRHRGLLRGGEDAEDVLICWSLSANKPLIIGLFCGNCTVQIRNLRIFDTLYAYYSDFWRRSNKICI